MAEMNATYNANLQEQVRRAVKAAQMATRTLADLNEWLPVLDEATGTLVKTATSLNDDLQSVEGQLTDAQSGRNAAEAALHQAQRELADANVQLHTWKTAPGATAFKEYIATKAENERLVKQVQNQSDEIANLSRLLASADSRNLILSRERATMEDELQGAQTSMNQWRDRAVKAEQDLRQTQAWGRVWERAYDANLAEREAMQALKKALQLKDFAGEPVAQLGQAWADAKTALQNAHSKAVGFFVDGIQKVQ